MLATEPFLIIGIVAAIRRLLVISAEAPDFLGQASFRDLMLEMGILGITTPRGWLLTQTLLERQGRGEPWHRCHSRPNDGERQAA